jgi:hypothetical protein
MPHMSSARRTRRPHAKAAKPDPVFEIVKHMHLPMLEARAFMNALFLMGHGMNELGRDDGETILTLAGAARERLEIIDDAIVDLIQVERG